MREDISLYERHESPGGRVRYEPVSQWVAWDSLPEGTWIIDVKPGRRSAHRVPADLAPVVAAMEPVRDRLEAVVRDALQEQPMPADTVAERHACRAALRAYKEAGGERYGPQWSGSCAHDIVEALFRAVAEVAK